MKKSVFIAVAVLLSVCLTACVFAPPASEPESSAPAPVADLQEEALIAAVKTNLGVPDRKTITYEIGEKVYWTSAERYCRDICFYENGQQVAGAIVDPATGELLRNIWKYQPAESLSAQLIRDIDGAYEEAQKQPEYSSTGGMVDLAAAYRDKWKQVADQYYEKIMNYDAADNVWSVDDLRRSVGNMKTRREQYIGEQSADYEKALYAIYGGSIVGPIAANYEYKLYKEWALELVEIYESLPEE